MIQLPDHPDIAHCLRTGYPYRYRLPYDEPDYAEIDEDEEDYEDVDEE